MGVIKGDTRSLDYSSYSVLFCVLSVQSFLSGHRRACTTSVSARAHDGVGNQDGRMEVCKSELLVANSGPTSCYLAT